MSLVAEKRSWLDLIIDTDEELAILSTEYLEDFYGVDGRLTLVHQLTGQEFDIVMSEVAGGGPFDYDHFEGTRDASTMPLGAYETRGRLRDVVGNYSIMNSVQSPFGGELILVLIFNLVENAGIISITFNIMRSPSVVFGTMRSPSIVFGTMKLKSN